MSNDILENIGIIGNSPEILKVIEMAGKIARGHAFTTLIVGENGTGKELFARLIHDSGPSTSNTFVDINCGAIPENLLESELFGHEKGAFTGAVSTKRGLLEVAEGGTVFLDEIGNLPFSVQNKLLKAVESKCIRRVGGLHDLKISTRIIAATNIDLFAAVKEGKFREDLYYRLNIGRIQIPPLRQREDDVILLAEHFIKVYNHEHNLTIKGLTLAAKDLIKKYPWPGNVRQLQNSLARAMLVETTDWIDCKHLQLDQQDVDKLQNESFQTAVTKYKKEYTTNFRIPTKGIALEDLERKILNSAVDKAKGNLSHAARLLKISRGKLRYRLEKLGMDIP